MTRRRSARLPERSALCCHTHGAQEESHRIDLASGRHDLEMLSTTKGARLSCTCQRTGGASVSTTGGAVPVGWLSKGGVQRTSWAAPPSRCHEHSNSKQSRERLSRTPNVVRAVGASRAGGSTRGTVFGAGSEPAQHA